MIPYSITRRLCAKCGSAIGEPHSDECPVDRHAPIIEVEYTRSDLNDLLRQQLEGAVEALAHDYLDYLREAIYLDDDLLVNLAKRAARNNTDSAGYLRWILTGKSPTADKPQ